MVEASSRSERLMVRVRSGLVTWNPAVLAGVALEFDNELLAVIGRDEVDGEPHAFGLAAVLKRRPCPGFFQGLQGMPRRSLALGMEVAIERRGILARAGLSFKTMWLPTAKAAPRAR
jgi:hypothetical protein